MADAVAGLRINDAVFLRDRGEKIVVIGILETDLHRIVIDIGNGELVLDVLNPH